MLSTAPNINCLLHRNSFNSSNFCEKIICFYALSFVGVYVLNITKLMFSTEHFIFTILPSKKATEYLMVSSNVDLG